MSDNHYNNGYDSGHDGDATISNADINQAAANAFKRGADALGNAELGKNKKFLGLITMDAGVVDMLDGAYNVGADFLTSSVRPKLFGLVEKRANSIFPGKGKTVGVVAVIGSNVALKTAGYFGAIWDSVSAQHKKRVELTHKLSPVLDDIKGNHSLVALYSTGINDNEVVFAHRKRLGAIADNQNLTNFTNLAVSSGASLLFDAKFLGHIWNTRADMTQEKMVGLSAGVPKAGQHEQHTAQPNAQTGYETFKLGAMGMLPQMAKRMAASNEYKLQKELQPYSALEMILELSEQVNSDPKARGFTVPRSFQQPHGRREQYSLEEYLMRICIQHQKDMSYIDPKYTEIREALREDLAATVKPLADAIRKGDYNVLSLVRLVGEGKIIKKQGRAIAPASDIQALIEKEEPKQATYAPVDPNEYYKDAAFSRAQMKSALKSLSGYEKTTFASMFPDSILVEAGMSKDDVKEIRHATATKYDRMLVEAIIGLNEKSDDVLKAEGLAHSEITQVREAAKKIREHGEAAAHALKTSAVNDHGIEHLLANVSVHQPTYLGKVMVQGRTKLAERAANDDEHAADDDEGQHSVRENNRRAQGQHAHSKN